MHTHTHKPHHTTGMRRARSKIMPSRERATVPIETSTDMGCSNSKEGAMDDSGSPSRSQEHEGDQEEKRKKKKSWEALLSKGLGVPSKLSSLRKLDSTGYIATTFSSNYNATLEGASYRTLVLDRDDTSIPQSSTCTEDFVCGKKKFGSVLGWPHAQERTFSRLSDVTSVSEQSQNIANSKALSTVQCVEKDMEASLELIDSRDLMKDLDEQVEASTEVVPALQSCANSLLAERGFMSNPPHKVSQNVVTYMEHRYTKLSTLLRAKYLLPYENIQHVDSSVPMKKNIVTGARNSLSRAEGDAEPCTEEEYIHSEKSACAGQQISDCEHVPIYGKESLSVHENVADAKKCQDKQMKPVEYVSFRKVPSGTYIDSDGGEENEEFRALCMKYIDVDDGINDEEFHTYSIDCSLPHVAMLRATLYNTDCDVDEVDPDLTSPSCKSSCPSSPDFSTVASLKDWLLPDEFSLFKLDTGNPEPDIGTSTLAASQVSPLPLNTSVVFPSVNRVLLKYVGEESDHPSICDVTTIIS